MKAFCALSPSLLHQSHQPMENIIMKTFTSLSDLVEARRRRPRQTRHQATARMAHRTRRLSRSSLRPRRPRLHRTGGTRRRPTRAGRHRHAPPDRHHVGRRQHRRWVLPRRVSRSGRLRHRLRHPRRRTAGSATSSGRSWNLSWTIPRISHSEVTILLDIPINQPQGDTT